MIDSILMTGSAFADWLERKYLGWQMENGRASIRKFSAWLGINHALIIQMMNAKGKPGPKTLPKLAEKLGYEVYDVLELPRPDARLNGLIRQYTSIPPEMQDEYSQAIREFTLAWAEHHGFELDLDDENDPGDHQDKSL